MQRMRLWVVGLSSLVGWSSLAIASTPISNHFYPAIANAVAPVSQSTRSLPKSIESQLFATLQTRLGLPKSATATMRVTQAEPATWKDCLPNAEGDISLNQSCETVMRSGWRVTVAAQGQNWVHYITHAGFITLDTPTSISPQVRSQLAKHLGISATDLKITAAELTTTFQACPVNVPCPSGYNLGWRVLANGRFFHLDSQGQEFPRGLTFRDSSAGLSASLKTQIVRDVVDRQGVMAANLAVESIKPTVWNWCRGNPSSIGGPTPPEMGACPDVNQAGWQVIVRSGALRYVYYPLKLAGVTAPPPDGRQSVPRQAIVLVQQLAAQRASTDANQMRAHRIDPDFFDRCLGENHDSLHCRQGIQAGWRVMALGGNALKNGATPAWVYHTNLLGDRATFVSSGQWLPIPSAPLGR